MPKNLTIQIASTRIAIEKPSSAIDWQLHGAYRPFIQGEQPDISIRLARGSGDVNEADKIFDSPPIWTLYRSGDTSIYKIYAKQSDYARTLLVSADVKQAELHFAPGSDPAEDPFYGPALELLMINHLALNRGFIVHAFGIDLGGSGLLFVGESGAGKSTLARLWAGEEGVEVLSDDRTIIRKQNGEFRMYGTPWHGEAKFGSPHDVKLERIFFLAHGRSNSVEQISKAQSVQHLLQCSFPPFWDAVGMGSAVDLFSELVSTVPCYRLEFFPDRRVVADIKT
jgi:hypothetical protein